MTDGADAPRSGIVVHDISRRYGTTLALDAVSLVVQGGRLHALLGANGSGKSTLVKCLCGVERPDAGSIDIAGKILSGFGAPAEAAAAGIGVVHQHTPLISTSSVAENVGVHLRFPTTGGLVSERQLKAQARNVMAAIDVDDAPPETIVADLDAGTRALVAVAIAQAHIAGRGRLLIIDEVTASMTSGAADRFLQGIRRLVDRGLAVLMVTHRLPEVTAYADEATVLTAGSTSAHLARSELTASTLAAALGVKANTDATSETDRISFRPSEPATANTVDRENGLELCGVAGLRLRPLTMCCRPGEITGLVGSTASGLNELAGILGGSAPALAGTILVDGSPVLQSSSPRRALRDGIAVLPADRLADGGMLSMSVRANMLLPTERRYRSDRAARRVVDGMLDELDVRPRRRDALLGALSGGNQQKVGLAKWLLTQPRVLVLDDPTNGVDPVSRLRLLDALRRQAARGLTVLLMSTEPETVAQFCDSVYLLAADGSVRHLPAGRDAKTAITLAMMG